MKRIIFHVLVLFLVIFMSHFPSSAMAFTFVDNFNDGTIGSSWTSNPGVGSTIQETGGYLIMTDGGNNQGLSQLILNQPLVGDFFAQIDFRLLDWPIGNVEKIGLVASNSLEQGSVELTGNWGYLTSFSDGVHGSSWSSNTDISGKLKIERKGSELSGYYWKDDGWFLIHSVDPSSMAASTLRILMWGEVAGTRVVFDNLYVNINPGVDSSVVPEPASMLLLGLGGLGIFVRRQGLKLV